MFRAVLFVKGPAQPANGAQPQAAGASSTQDYSAEWANYYRSIGKIEEAEAIEKQIASAKVSKTSPQLNFRSNDCLVLGRSIGRSTTGRSSLRSSSRHGHFLPVPTATTVQWWLSAPTSAAKLSAELWRISRRSPELGQELVSRVAFASSTMISIFIWLIVA